MNDSRPPEAGDGPGYVSELFLQIHPDDTVAVALADVPRGAPARAGGRALTARDAVPAGHKIALVDRRAGEEIIKYGAPIGRATAAIAAGDHVHGHNLASSLAASCAPAWRPGGARPLPAGPPATFLGYRRGDGSAGTRNELWIVPTVGCINRVAERLAASAARYAGAGIDGVHALTHPCGCSQLGEDHRATQRILAGLARHPNAGGVLVLGLGCENNCLGAFTPLLGDIDPRRVKWLDCQRVGDEMAAGEALLAELAAFAAQAAREPLPVSRLVVGVKCGGSDAFSGITANPLVGQVADRVAAAGGSVLLTETPECFGAEARLLDRCADREVFDALAAAIADFKTYYTAHGQPVYENPSPGNRAGGITTLEEKSLGCVQKGGAAPVADALPYGARVRRPGLSVLDGPGNDLVSATALAAAGAQVVLFTTGRGTPLGAPVPTVKIASHGALARHKPHWIDFDAGRLLAGETLPALSDELFALLLATASGRRARHEETGDRQIAIWKNGVTL